MIFTTSPFTNCHTFLDLPLQRDVLYGRPLNYSAPHCLKAYCIPVSSLPAVSSLRSRATGNSRFKVDKFPVLFWKNPENSRLELMTSLQANKFIFARK